MAPVPSGMAKNRMDRSQFFAKLATFDEDRLKKALWNVYWRGSAIMRERIEAELDPVERERRRSAAKEPADAGWVLYEVREFVSLARAGSYLGGDRQVTPKERSRWRFTLQRLIKDALGALAVEETEEADLAASAVEQLVELACEMRATDYFRSEDPVEAARFVVSDAVAALWSAIREHHDFATFAERAAPQLVRWESRHGWTRTGWGSVPAKETSLAIVVSRMLTAPDMWVGFSDRYLAALDELARAEPTKPKYTWRTPEQLRAERTSNLAAWHLLLLEQLIHSEAEDRLDRLAGHPALGGPELCFLQAQLAELRGARSAARDLVSTALAELPGHSGFLEFARAIGAALPARAKQPTDRSRP